MLMPPPDNPIVERIAALTAELTVQRVADAKLSPIALELARLTTQVSILNAQLIGAGEGTKGLVQRHEDLEREVRQFYARRADCERAHRELEQQISKQGDEQQREKTFRDRLEGAWTFGAKLAGVLALMWEVANKILRVHHP